MTLSASFLETLEAGEHTIEATFDDGKAQASFTVENASTSEPEPEPKPEPAPGEDPKDEKKPATPKSGDATSVEAIVSVAMTASAMLGGAVVLRRKDDDSR